MGSAGAETAGAETAGGGNGSEGQGRVFSGPGGLFLRGAFIQGLEVAVKANGECLVVATDIAGVVAAAVAAAAVDSEAC